MNDENNTPETNGEELVFRTTDGAIAGEPVEDLADETGFSEFSEFSEEFDEDDFSDEDFDEDFEDYEDNGEGATEFIVTGGYDDAEDFELLTGASEDTDWEAVEAAFGVLGDDEAER